MDLEKHPGQARAFHQAESGVGVIAIGDERGTAAQGDLTSLLAQQPVGDGEMRRVLPAIEARLERVHKSSVRPDGPFNWDVGVMTDLGEAMEVLPAQPGRSPEL